MVLGLHVGSVFMLWVLLVLYVSGAGEGDALIKDSNPGSSAFRVLSIFTAATLPSIWCPGKSSCHTMTSSQGFLLVLE